MVAASSVPRTRSRGALRSGPSNPYPTWPTGSLAASGAVRENRARAKTAWARRAATRTRRRSFPISATHATLAQVGGDWSTTRPPGTAVEDTWTARIERVAVSSIARLRVRRSVRHPSRPPSKSIRRSTLRAGRAFKRRLATGRRVFAIGAFGRTRPSARRRSRNSVGTVQPEQRVFNRCRRHR